MVECFARVKKKRRQTGQISPFTLNAIFFFYFRRVSVLLIVVQCVNHVMRLLILIFCKRAAYYLKKYHHQNHAIRLKKGTFHRKHNTHIGKPLADLLKSMCTNLQVVDFP
mmetsp:Transcript_1604/g.2297  ORF Transcript_1604/g.2297 Transcript_1604/m.2297 type:complete len:110 (+) Transcript_1604:1416-1745(+)